MTSYNYSAVIGANPKLRYLAEVAHRKAHGMEGPTKCPTGDLAWWAEIIDAVLSVGIPANTP